MNAPDVETLTAQRDRARDLAAALEAELAALRSDPCPAHLTCDTCRREACEPCGVGEPLGGCLHRTPWTCVTCRVGACDDCAAEVA